MSDKETMHIFSVNLKEFLESREMSQAELARRLDVCPQTISNWINEAGCPRMGKLDKMCDIFHCTRSDLMEDHTKDEGFNEFRQIMDLLKNPVLKELLFAGGRIAETNEEFLQGVIATMNALK